VLKADSYAAALEETQGIIAEFVNPKYKDDTRTAFKSSTRLECMMQDFPHGLPPTANVGFTVINQACAQQIPRTVHECMHDPESVAS
jgi:UDP-sugar pyrophosphorylase